MIATSLQVNTASAIAFIFLLMQWRMEMKRTSGGKAQIPEEAGLCVFGWLTFLVIAIGVSAKVMPSLPLYYALFGSAALIDTRLMFRWAIRNGLTDQNTWQFIVTTGIMGVVILFHGFGFYGGAG